MADISIIGRLINGIQRNIDLSTNTLVVDAVKVGGGAGTSLTKTILDNLITLQNGSDAGSLHTHDGRYFTETELGSSTSSSGSDLIGDDNTYNNFTPSAATVKGALAGIDEALAGATAASAEDSVFRIVNTDDSSKKIAFDASAIETDTTRTIRMPDIDIDLIHISNLYSLTGREPGDVDLGTFTGGIIPDDETIKNALQSLENAIVNLPDPMEYKGNWAASTNTPTLADGVGNNGDVYYVTDAGTVDFGSGDISFETGDRVVYSGTASVWQKWDTTDQVTSVNGLTGAVTLDTDDVAEGSTNKYFSVAAARAAAVVDSTAGSQTDQAPSVSATKAAVQAETDRAEAAESDLSGRIDALEVGASSLIADFDAGEAFAADTSFLVRFAVSGETSGRVYKADKDASSADKFYAFGVGKSVAGASIADPVSVTMQGTHTLGANDSAFSSGDIGKAVYLTAAGAFSVTAPTSANEAAYRIGVVQTTTSIFVGTIQLNGIN